jgi:toxin ParE1/3/4
VGQTKRASLSASPQIQVVHEVIWAPAAVAQLRAIRDYIEQFNPRAAEEVAAHLLNVGNSLEEFPHRGRSVPGTDIRELVTNYPYIIRYRIVGSTVRILRVNGEPRESERLRSLRPT